MDTPRFKPVDPAQLGITDPHVEIDPTKPSPARMYDYYLGGKDNFPADREAADKALTKLPQVPAIAHANRGFLRRAVTYVAGQGVDQFLDLGSGLPTQDNVHQVAQRVTPGARVVYVDNDPIVLAHGRALLADDDSTVVVTADMRNAAAVRAAANRLIDWSQPVGLQLVSVLHFFPDPEARDIVAGLVADLPAGSFLTLSHGSATPEAWNRTADAATVYDQASSGGFWLRRPEDIIGLFGAAELADPGLVPVQDWRPDEDTDSEPIPGGTTILGGVARLR